MTINDLRKFAREMKKLHVSEVQTEGMSLKLHPMAFAPKHTVREHTPKTPEEARKLLDDDLYFSTTPTRKKA